MGTTSARHQNWYASAVNKRRAEHYCPLPLFSLVKSKSLFLASSDTEEDALFRSFMGGPKVEYSRTEPIFYGASVSPA